MKLSKGRKMKKCWKPDGIAYFFGCNCVLLSQATEKFVQILGINVKTIPR